MINRPQPQQAQYDSLQSALAGYGIYPYSQLLDPLFMSGFPALISGKAYTLPPGLNKDILAALLSAITGHIS